MASVIPKTSSHPVQVTDRFDMTDPDMYGEDRWQARFRDLRATAPVCKVAESDFGAHWNVSTYKPIQHVEALPDIYSSSYEFGGITLADRTDAEIEAQFELPMFIAMDRPKHTGQRRAVAPKFSPTHMKDMADDIRRRTGETLDELPVGKAFDWVDRVSIELTTQMLALLFDFPWEDRRKLTFWSDWAGDIEIARDPARRQERIAHLYEMGAYFKRLWDARVDQPPAPDLISMMIHSDATNHMSELEFMGNLVLLIVGGNDTTRNTMSGLAYGLDKFPEERAKLERNPALIANATSEIIRWQTPLAHMRRTALRGHRAVRCQDQAGRQAGAVVYFRQPRRDGVRGCRPSDCGPRQCAAASGVRVWHPPLRRGAARRIAGSDPAGGNGAAAAAHQHTRRTRACACLFRARLPRDAGRTQPLLTFPPVMPVAAICVKRQSFAGFQRIFSTTALENSS